jgi:hypothetical protein
MSKLILNTSTTDDIIDNIKGFATKIATETINNLNTICDASNCDCRAHEVSFDFITTMPPEPHRQMFAFFVESILFHSGAYSEVTFKKIGKTDKYNVHVHAFRKEDNE